MMGHVVFNTLGAGASIIMPYEHYGLYLVNYDAPPPEPKLYRVSIEGRSGSIDMSEWAGDVFYESRKVTIRFRDMHGTADDLINKLNGRRINVRFDEDDPAYYYSGRVDSITRQTRNRVTDLTMQLTCDPFKYPVVQDATGQYISTGMPYTGYYNFSSLIANAGSKSWTFELYQDKSFVSLTISGEFDINNEMLGNRSKIVINGAETAISQRGTMQVETPLIKGQNTIAVYNNQSGDVTFTASVKFQNRVM